MDTAININFKVTPSQKETIDLRVSENGFDDISAYLKVIALKVQAFNFTTAGESQDEATVELGFTVTKMQEERIQENLKENNCEDLSKYLRYVALHGVVTAVVEIRSTGNLEAMLNRIAKTRNISL